MNEKTEVFNEYEAQNARGNELSDTITTFLEVIVESNRDIRLTDIEMVIYRTVGAYFSEQRLRQAMRMRKEKLQENQSALD